MDLRRLRSGELLAAVSGVGLLAVMFLDWFGGRPGWEALTLVVLTVTARPVAMAGSAASITVGVAAIVLLYLLFRIVVNEPGPDAGHAIGLGAYLGLLAVAGCLAGAWLALGDERTNAPASLRQTERVLAVRGAPRPAPPERDPGRPSPRA
jgi:hypothetical protein